MDPWSHVARILLKRVQVKFICGGTCRGRSGSSQRKPRSFGRKKRGETEKRRQQAEEGQWKAGPEKLRKKLRFSSEHGRRGGKRGENWGKERRTSQKKNKKVLANGMSVMF